jgi:hypothetical protein
MSAPLGQKLKFWFLGFVFGQAGTDLEKDFFVRQQDHKSSFGKNFRLTLSVLPLLASHV